MNSKFKNRSPSKIIMGIALYTGCFYFSNFRILKKDPRSYQLAASRLVKSGYLQEKKYNMNRRIHRVLIPTQKIFLDEALQDTFFPEDFLYGKFYNQEFRKKGFYRTSDMFGIRMLSVSTAVATFYSIGITANQLGLMADKAKNFYPGYKPTPKTTAKLSKNMVAIYTTHELKSFMVKEKARSCSGKSHAYIIDNGQIYAVLYICDLNFQLKLNTEKYSNSIIRTELNQLYINKDSKTEKTAYIFLAKDIRILSQLLTKNTYGSDIIADDKEILLIPSTMDGSKLLALIFSNESRKYLKYYKSDSKQKIKESLNVDCDYIQEDKYILSFFVPDICKLKKIIQSAEIRPDEKFEIYTFEIYRGELEKIISEYKNINLKSYSLDEAITSFVSQNPPSNTKKRRQET